MTARRARCAPSFYPKCTPPLSWPHKFDPTARRRRPPTSLTAAYPERRERKKDIRYRERITRPRRPLPLYGTFRNWALAVAKEPERHAAEVADGAAGGLDLCGCVGHRGQRPPDRCPLNRVVRFKRRPERRCVGRLSGFGLQHALMSMTARLRTGASSAIMAPCLACRSKMCPSRLMPSCVSAQLPRTRPSSLTVRFRLIEEASEPTLEEVLDRAGGSSGGSVPLQTAVATLRADRDRR